MPVHAIAVMSFNRPDYLSQVLDSLVAQESLGDRPIFLFQDNAVNRYSKIRHADDDDIRKCIALFEQKVPYGSVMLAEDNICSFENYRRAEEFFFTELGCDAGYFFEDDLILSPHYFTMMDRIYAYAAAGEVGYFTAYGRLTEPKKGQELPARSLQRMRSHWGFGLTRAHWLELDRWLAPYNEFVLGRDYRQRPTREILRYFRERQIPLDLSSQDAIRKAGTYALGRVCLNTVACFGRYIGARGMHMTPELFEKAGYAATVISPEPVELAFPSPSDLAKLRSQELWGQWRRIDASVQA